MKMQDYFVPVEADVRRKVSWEKKNKEIKTVEVDGKIDLCMVRSENPEEAQVKARELLETDEGLIEIINIGKPRTDVEQLRVSKNYLLSRLKIYEVHKSEKGDIQRVVRSLTGIAEHYERLGLIDDAIKVEDYISKY